MFHTQEAWDLFVHYSAVIAFIAVVWAMIEVVLAVVWLVKSKKLRKNLHNLIMMSSSVWASDENHIYIQFGDTTVIIEYKSFYMRSNDDRVFNLRFGVLQSIMTKRLHERAREMVKIKEALE